MPPDEGWKSAAGANEAPDHPTRERDADSAESERLREHIRKLVLMKETGPKSAAWHRARVRTIWRLHRQVEAAAAAEQERTGDTCS